MELTPEVAYFIDRLKISSYDMCTICTHYLPCKGRKCPHFVEGNEGYLNGKLVKFHWTCEDCDYGDCVVREKFCKGCIEDDFKNFEWEGVK